ncbi:hypothetical protein AVEN_44394-1 [Araneus ventricosus]|uniref:Uncharacterized protein n=1 Tax=Araneus ventricosus TaxID=182803 RepID=A0A4Y2K4R2_ARAVE|nr:hypothetical protein AVEN_44394-1 [Araneus ventricosus]
MQSGLSVMPYGTIRDSITSLDQMGTSVNQVQEVGNDMFVCRLLNQWCNLQSSYFSYLLRCGVNYNGSQEFRGLFLEGRTAGIERLH